MRRLIGGATAGNQPCVDDPDFPPIRVDSPAILTRHIDKAENSKSGRSCSPSSTYVISFRDSWPGCSAYAAELARVSV